MTRKAQLAMVMWIGIAAGELAAGAAAMGATIDPPAETAPPPAPSRPIVSQLEAEAARLRPLIKTDAVRALLDAVPRLPEPEPRTIYRNDDRSRVLSQREFDTLSDVDKQTLKARKCEPQFYYYTGYGSPLIYARPLDLVAQRAGWSASDGLKGKRILDFGYGLIGHLRLLALRGADVTGMEVEPMLRALYSEPGDTGRIDGGEGTSGNLRVLHGRWPAEEFVTTAAAEGGSYDLIISKNVLKRGYIHPARKVDERQLVKLGVDDETFVAKLHGALKPGGYAMIYNISPAQNAEDSGKPYLPHADGECPFPRDMLEKAGLEVLEFDRPDTSTVLDVWIAMEIEPGKPRDELAKNLFAWYTLVRRK